MELPLYLLLRSIQGIIFCTGNRGILLASLSKDNIRGKVGNGRDGFLWLLGLRIGKLYFYLLTSGTRVHLVCQAMLAYSSTPNPNMGDYKGWIGLSSPVAYPSTMGNEVNECSL